MSTVPVTPSGPDEVVSVFEPHTLTIPALRPYFQEVWARRRFVRATARAELQGQHSTMLIGQLWAVLDPLFQAATYGLLFSILRVGGANRQLTLLIVGVFLFNATRVSIVEGARSVVNGRRMVLNSTFPRALLPITCVYRAFVQLAPAGLVYLVIHVLAGKPIGPGIAFLPLLLALHVALNLGLALLLAALTVYVRDITKMLGYLLRILLFVTPVLYPASFLTSLPGVRWVLLGNPLFPVFAAYQQVMLGGLPTVGQIVAALVWAAVFLAAGSSLFLSHERAFALHV